MYQGAAEFWPKGQIFNKLGRGLLGDATNKIKAVGLVVSDKKIFFMFSLHKSKQNI